MIRTLEIKLALPEGTRLHPSACSLLHGVLMQSIDRDYAALLHQQSLRPYSQHLYFDKERNGLYWRLTALNDVADSELLGAAYALPDSIYLQQKQMEIRLVGKTFLPATSYSAIAEKCFAHPLAGRYLCLDFVTSTSFKIDGQYAIYPQQHLLLKSLLRRWNAFADKEKLEAQELAKDLAGETFVADYRLGLQSFSVDGVRIPAFRGKYVLGLKKNIMSNRIIAMLGEYSNYSGIGIKTALGMGAVRTKLLAKFY